MQNSELLTAEEIEQKLTRMAYEKIGRAHV